MKQAIRADIKMKNIDMNFFEIMNAEANRLLKNEIRYMVFRQI